MNLFALNGPYISKVLTFLVLLFAFSKEFLLLDEHTILLVAFLIFVLSIYDVASDAIYSTLQDRSMQVQLLFQDFFKTQKSLLLESKSIYERLVGVEFEFLNLFKWTDKVVSIQSNLNASLNGVPSSVLRLNLNFLLREQNSFRKNLYLYTVSALIADVVNDVQLDGASFVDQSIQTLER